MFSNMGCHTHDAESDSSFKINLLACRRLCCHRCRDITEKMIIDPIDSESDNVIISWYCNLRIFTNFPLPALVGTYVFLQISRLLC